MTNTDTHSNVFTGFPRRPLTTLLVAASCAFGLAGCSRDATAHAPAVRADANEQAIVQRSAAAFERVRQDPRFARTEFYLERAHAVMIFPRLVKASLVVGGEGGNGVLIARQTDGSWSSPAFYSLGSPSVGLQIGYQAATVVLFIMDQPTLEHVLQSSIALGGKAGTTLGDVGDDSTKGNVMSANMYQLVDADGLFAGLSFDGYVIGARSRHNLEYYGKPVSPRDILMNRAVRKPEADVLARALSPRAQPDAKAVSLR